MDILYIVITILLYVALIIMAWVSGYEISEFSHKADRKRHWQIWSACVSGSIILIPLWPIALVLALPTFIVYGLVQAVKLLREERAKSKAAKTAA